MTQETKYEYLLATKSQEKWKKIGLSKRVGVVAPIFSLCSKQSQGIGDLNDLKLLVDWAAKSGNSIIQLLPMNELGGVFCPYDSVSSFALEPSYICLKDKFLPKNKTILARIDALSKNFPSTTSNVDYGVKKEKLDLLWEIFSINGVMDAVKFNKFQEANSYWLFDFALYKALKSSHGESAWYDWDPGYRDRNKESLDSFYKAHEKEITFQMWLQWILFEQFQDLKDYAALKNILIKGDLPILVSRDSADVWQQPHFFKLDFAAGAPPDMYCAKGQRWGMPTYNWEKIEQDGFRYLKERLKYAENFYDILRIDHVVGLFRIWSIPYNDPKENQGLHGSFDPSDESKWCGQGKKILNVMLDSSKMALCAEDLGTIPKCCTDTLKELGIPGNDVQRWVKDWSVKHDFLMPQDYRALSVAMLSTHDTTNWSAWWKYEAGTVDEALFVRKCNDRGIDFSYARDNLFDLNLSCHGRLRWLDSIDSVDALLHVLAKPREKVGDFISLYLDTYQEKEKLWSILEMPGKMQEDAGNELIYAALNFTLESQAIFCIQLITDWLSIAGIFKGDPYQYRINTPGIISNKNWSMRLPISLDDLLRHHVTGEIKKMVVDSNRV
ncbi:MAG: 4-alpha-glucanotransferase [Candidatus Omnitrophica bacterium]|nr:4-alpha-glucanotransferase [Candidatus Omnitrophota bacterium]